jgi:DNA topoisomerase-1
MPLTDVKDEEEQTIERKPAPEDKVLGAHNGLNIYLKKGPYGFYIQLGEDATATTEKPKRIALPKYLNPEEVTFEQADTLVSLPKDIGGGITVNIGKFGPYIKQGTKSRSLTGNDTIFNITQERAEALLSNAVPKDEGKVLGQHPKTRGDIVLRSGRYGAYLKYNNTNYHLPKDFQEKEISLDDALKIIGGEK